MFNKKTAIVCAAAAAFMTGATTVASASVVNTDTLNGNFVSDSSSNNDLPQLGTTPFYLNSTDGISDVTVTGTVDVSGFSTGGEVVYVGLYQPDDNNSFVLFRPRAQIGYLGNTTGAIGQGAAGAPGENAQQSLNLLGKSNTVDATFSFSQLTATFLNSGNASQDLSLTYDTDASHIDLSKPVYAYALAYVDPAGSGQTANWNVTFSQTVVPEPSSLAIFLGLGGLALLSRRTRRKVA